MRLEWRVTAEDGRRIREFVRGYEKNPLVRIRKKRNLAARKPEVRRADFWKQMVCMRLTTQQKSGPESYVARFVRRSPFPLEYQECLRHRDAGGFIARALSGAGGIRFASTIAEELGDNLAKLEAGEWARALATANRLSGNGNRLAEITVADYVQDTFKGFGPKQSRNLLQALGLTRYEIPIDSRVTRWLNAFEFPITLSAAGLADRHYYRFVSDGIQALCARARVFPCLLDAAIFASFDRDAWTAENVVY